MTVIETLEQEIGICNREIRKAEDELLRATERKAHYDDRKIMLRDLLKQAQEEAKKVSALEDKHFNECAQIMRYDNDIKMLGNANVFAAVILDENTHSRYPSNALLKSAIDCYRLKNIEGLSAKSMLEMIIKRELGKGYTIQKSK